MSEGLGLAQGPYVAARAGFEPGRYGALYLPLSRHAPFVEQL